MITDIKIVHDDPNFDLSKFDFPYPVYVDTIDYGTKNGKKKGYEIKSEWGARENPFIICYDGEKVVKCFYTEADNNVYESLIKYLNESRND